MTATAGDIAANTITALEVTIASRLQAEFPDLAVEPFPDDPEEYRLNSPIGALLVRYHGAKYGDATDVHVMAQEKSAAVEITLVFRRLDGKEGVYHHLDAVRAALTGFVPEGWERLRPLAEEFVFQQGGLWRYAMDFVTQTVVMEILPPDNAPVLTQVQYVDK